MTLPEIQELPIESQRVNVLLNVRTYPGRCPADEQDIWTVCTFKKLSRGYLPGVKKGLKERPQCPI